jgi:hypothetical protein
MAKNTREGNRERAARRREALTERGIKQVLLLAPEQAHPLLKQAASLMTRADDPMEPRTALRRAGGANEPERGEASLEPMAELEAARNQIIEIERQAEKHRIEIEAQAAVRERALQAERDAARAAEMTERKKALATAAEAEATKIIAQAAQEQAIKALGRAEKAETAIHQARNLPGVRGRLVRWLAGDVLVEQQADRAAETEDNFP